MLVGVCLPCAVERWPSFAFGFLADFNTCSFHYPLCSQRSWRLFLGCFLIACNETLADHKTGISISIALHPTLRTEHQWGTRGIPLCWLSRIIASNEIMATSTLPTGVSWIDPTGENAFVVGFVFRVLEDASLHPECPFAIASVAVLALQCLHHVRLASLRAIHI